MFVGSLMMTLYLPECESLKDKRRVVQSILTKMRSKHRVAAAEVDDLSIWNRAVLGCACVSNSHRHVQEIMDCMVRWVELNYDVDITQTRMEIF